MLILALKCTFSRLAHNLPKLIYQFATNRSEADQRDTKHTHGPTIFSWPIILYRKCLWGKGSIEVPSHNMAYFSSTPRVLLLWLKICLFWLSNGHFPGWLTICRSSYTNLQRTDPRRIKEIPSTRTGLPSFHGQ